MCATLEKAVVKKDVKSNVVDKKLVCRDAQSMSVIVCRLMAISTNETLIYVRI